MDYWTECVEEAFCDAGLEATKKQVDCVANWVEGAHENFGMATGQDVASQNYHDSYEAKIAKANSRAETEVHAISDKYEKKLASVHN